MHKLTLAELYEEHHGKVSDKWSLYLSEYDRLFDRFRDSPVRLLEIGVQNGGSLELWQRYFPNAELFIGCDIDENCRRLKFGNTRTQIVIGDAGTEAVAREILEYSSTFDIIIDDGSHRSSDIIRAFCQYFPHLIDGGLYVAEDLHCSYWSVTQGGLYDPSSSISFFKRLIDVANHEHWGLGTDSTFPLRGIFDQYACDLPAHELAHVHAIQFLNSMCVVEKVAPISNLLGLRVITGDEALVNPLAQQQVTLQEPAPDQRNNPLSNRHRPPEEELFLMELAFADLLDQLPEGLSAERTLKEMTSAATAEIQRTRAAVQELEARIHDRERTLALSRQVSRNLEAEKIDLDSRLASALQTLGLLQGSRTWRMTAPLRLAGSGARKILEKLRKYSSRSLEFDAEWYRTHYVDVAAEGGDALSHYLSHGIAEGRAPNAAAYEGIIVGPTRMEVCVRSSAILVQTLLSPHRLRRAWGLLLEGGFKTLATQLMRSAYPGRATAAEAPRDERNDYGSWLRAHEDTGSVAASRLRQIMASFNTMPTIAIVMPTYNSKPAWLNEAIQSVCSQLYEHWELCIVDDASTDPDIHTLLSGWARREPRIRVVFREHNGHISEASNSALAVVSAPWLALLDHDDLLHPHALFWLVSTLQTHPEAKLLFSDEDKIDEEGQRFAPHFKPDWNRELFYSYNMISHLAAYRTDLVRTIGGFRRGFEGSQDYDLALRYIERISEDKIIHIPKVLYHWRVHNKSTALSADTKPYAQLAGIRALNEHFERIGLAAQAEACRVYYRIRYPLPPIPPKVSILIPTRNGLELIRQCIESIYQLTTYPNFEILIIDNGSDDPGALLYFEALQAAKRARVLRDDRPFNYSALNNRAVLQAKGEFLCLLNNDVEVITASWLEEMVSIALQPTVGAVGARLWYPDNTIQHAGVILGIGGVAGHVHAHLPKGHSGYFSRADRLQSLSAVTGACLMVRKASYLAVGGLNEHDLSIAFNDVDFCLRLREAGYRTVWTPYAELYHHESATRGYEDTPAKKERFARESAYMRKRWGPELDADPAYNPNLTLDSVDFALAWPPRGGVQRVDEGQ